MEPGTHETGDGGGVARSWGIEWITERLDYESLRSIDDRDLLISSG